MMKRPIAAPMRRLFSGTTAVWGIGSPRGTAKKRDHGEPVRARPDHAGFRERAEIGRQDPARRRAPHREIYRSHQNEQHRGDRAHPAQFSPALGLGFEDVGRSEQRRLGGRKSSKLCHRKFALVQSDLRIRSAIIGAGHAPAIEQLGRGGGQSRPDPNPRQAAASPLSRHSAVRLVVGAPGPRLPGRTMPPLSLSDEELSLLRSLAEPVAYGRRREFLLSVAAALERCPQPGPGATYRIARDVQRRFVLTSQRVAPRAPAPRAWRAQDGP